MYQVSWLIRNKVMLITAKGDVTAGEILSGISLKHVMLTDRTLAENVHCIVDNRELDGMPLNPSIRLKLAQSEAEHGGWTIHIEDKPLVRSLTDLTQRVVTGRSVKTFASIDKALTFLYQEDASLASLKSISV